MTSQTYKLKGTPLVLGMSHSYITGINLKVLSSKEKISHFQLSDHAKKTTPKTNVVLASTLKILKLQCLLIKSGDCLIVVY